MCEKVHLSLCMAAGKLLDHHSRVTDTTVGELQPYSHLLHIKDQKSNIDFLVDTGAEINLVKPLHSELRYKTNDYHLIAANGAKIPTYGSRVLFVTFNGVNVFRWIFVAADTMHNILGADFLRHFGFCVDFGSACLRDNRTSSHWLMHSKLVAHVSAPLPYLSNSSYLKLLARYPDLTKPPNKVKPVKHNVVHHIVTNGHPCSTRSRQLSPEKLAIVQEEIDYLLETGVISRSSSLFSSPLHMVPKGETGKFRLVGDYRVLNQHTIPDLYPTPSVQHLLARLHGSTIFSKIDLVLSLPSDSAVA